MPWPISELPYPFELSFMQRALVAGVVIGVVAPLIGTFLIQKQMSLLGDGIGHLAFAGVGAGLLIGVWPVWSALAVAGVGAVGVEWLRSRGRASGDLALALFFYSGIAAGIVLVSRAGAANTVNAYLFGQILTVRPTDVWATLALGAAVVVALAITARALFAVVLDEEWARVAGLPVGFLNTMLAVLTATAIVAAMQVVGILLVAGLMVLPVASGQLLARSFRGTLVWSVGVGVGSVVLGLVAARLWDLAPSGTVVLVSAAAFVVVSVVTGSAARAVLGHSQSR